MVTPLGVDLAARAREVLEHNRRESWTCPSTTLYPHQWLWDTCFTAIGLARHDPQRGARELRALFRGQWANGLLPHMIFVGDGDAGSRRMWSSKKHPLAPRDVDTSCVTQPPLPAVAVQRVAAALPVADRVAFLAELLPKLVAYHAWLYKERDPHDMGLVTLIHPWECGLDTTPPWMETLGRMQLPAPLRMAIRLHLARLLRALRRDTRYLPAAERASDDDGLRMLLLVARAREHGFELERMPRDRSVLIEDLAFNAMLAVANRSLELIAAETGDPLPSALVRRFHRTDAAFEQLWDEPSGQYFSRDAVTGELIMVPTIATFLPLWAHIPSAERATRLIELLRDPAAFWPLSPVPSVPVDAPQFQEARYWKGPSWVNMNWAIAQGLRTYEEHELADELDRRTVGLVEHAGFFEYFSPLSGDGYGAPDFSWTAALTVDLLAHDRG